ncbi:MAG: thiolase domain-containing protein [Candidatus Bathyarchaeia archaeon]
MSLSLKRKVAVIGAGMTRFHNRIHAGKTSRELFVEAAMEAVESVDKGFHLKDVEALYVGNFSSDIFEHQCHLAPLLADWLGLCPKPATRIENACGSGGAALQVGVMAIASGLFDVVMVGGVEKMTNLPTEEVTNTLAMASDNFYEASLGMTFPGIYAEMASAYFSKYGERYEWLASVTIKNHHNGKLNPKAHFQDEVLELGNRFGEKKGIHFKDEMEFLKSPLNYVVAHPLRLFDCCPISDGAAVVILTNAERAKEWTDTPIYVEGVGQASDTMALHDRSELTSIRGTVEAGRRAFRMAEIEPEDVDLAIVHDCFTIAEIIATEDLGFFERGKGGEAAEDGVTALDGDIPVNTDGGLKAKGHPVGATGVAMVYESWKQLRGEAGARQVPRASKALIHNVGASGGTVVVQVLGR